MASFSLFIFISALLTLAAAHSYMTSPTSRSNQAQSQSGCRGPECLGPCDIPLSKATRAPISAYRGMNIKVDWPRNNHAGGFIRFAWAPTSQSDSHAAFDSHVQQINCHEIGNPTPGQCAPSDPANDPNGGGSGPGDGSFGACNTNITVPLDLTDGKWTLQWAWFGGAFSLGDYYSCTDFSISGGPTGTLTPVFKGGDFSYPNQQKCKFFNTDKLHVCTNEPCQNPLFSGAQAGPPAAGQLGSVVVSTPPVSIPPVSIPPVSIPPVSVPIPPVIKSTTGARKVNTPAPVPVQPSTTGQNKPSTPVSVPTPVPVPTPTPAPVPVSTPSTSLSTCAGSLVLSSSTARVAEADAWGNSFHALIEITVDESILSDWVLEVIWPDTSVQVTSSFNGGKLNCERDGTSLFTPMASWANNMRKGSTITVELIANRGDLTSEQILATVTTRVLKH